MPGPIYVKDFKFPKSAGFTGSSEPRQRFAEGGAVRKPKPPTRTPPPKKGKDATTPAPERRVSTVDALRGVERRRREEELGLKKGGKVKRAMGGPVAAKKGGKIGRDC